MLQDLISNRKLRANAVVAFYPAVSKGDDILILNPESGDPENPLATLYGLRQQADKEHDQPCFCVSDFVCPLEQKKLDYVGFFACTAGLGAHELADFYEKEQMDDYSSIMVKALADRLAEVGILYWGNSIFELFFWSWLDALWHDKAVSRRLPRSCTLVYGGSCGAMRPRRPLIPTI